MFVSGSLPFRRPRAVDVPAFAAFLLIGLSLAHARQRRCLNTAPRDEILLVPGVGARIAHEFEEYRPYRAIAQFRKEIGKYVDEKEVARLERYVTLQ